MSIQVKEAKRVFRVTGTDASFDLPDPHPMMAPQRVLQHYTPHNTILAGAVMLTPVIDAGEVIFEFAVKQIQ